MNGQLKFIIFFFRRYVFVTRAAPEFIYLFIIIIISEKMLCVGVSSYSERVQGHAGGLHEVQHRQEAKQGNLTDETL